MSIDQKDGTPNKKTKTDLVTGWGKIQVKPIENGNEYWALMEELLESKSGFFYNRAILLDAMLKGQLFGLEVQETDTMFQCTKKDPIFMNNPHFHTHWMLPCLCVKVKDTAEIVWVHPRARRRGFGTQMVNQLNIKFAWNIMDSSKEFWESVNIPNV